MRIAYITTYFPLLSQTFVYREVLKLQEMGISVQCFSVKRPKEVVREVTSLHKKTTYLWPLNLILFAKAHVCLFWKSPKNYFSTFLFQWHSGGKRALSRLRGLVHFFEGVYFAYFCVTRKIEHIHAHFAHGPASVALVANQLSKIPFSFTAHANDIFVNQWLLAEKIKAAKFVVTISHFNKKFLSQTVSGVEAEKIVVIPCGVSLNEFRPQRRVFRRSNNILSVGRLVEKKGFKYLLQACKLLKEWDVPFKCTIIGDGEDREFLYQLANKLDLYDHVLFAGALGQGAVRQRLKEADIFVLPAVTGKDGDRDGIPVSLMEAMAAGVPCVSTSVSGIPELIHDGHNGRLVQPQEPHELAQAMKALILDDELRTRLGKAARKTIKIAFDIETNVARLAKLF